MDGRRCWPWLFSFLTFWVIFCLMWCEFQRAWWWRKQTNGVLKKKGGKSEQSFCTGKRCACFMVSFTAATTQHALKRNLLWRYNQNLVVVLLLANPLIFELTSLRNSTQYHGQQDGYRHVVCVTARRVGGPFLCDSHDTRQQSSPVYIIIIAKQNRSVFAAFTFYEYRQSVISQIGNINFAPACGLLIIPGPGSGYLFITSHIPGTTTSSVDVMGSNLPLFM